MNFLLFLMGILICFGGYLYCAYLNIYKNIENQVLFCLLGYLFGMIGGVLLFISIGLQIGLIKIILR